MLASHGVSAMFILFFGIIAGLLWAIHRANLRTEALRILAEDRIALLLKVIEVLEQARHAEYPPEYLAVKKLVAEAEQNYERSKYE